MMTRQLKIDAAIGIVALAIGTAMLVHLLVACAPVSRSAVHARPSTSRALEPGGMTDAACLDLMDKRDGAQLAGKILAGVGGVSALATAPDSVPEGARWSIGAGAATTAAVSVGVLWYSERKSDEFEKYCEVAEKDELAPNPFADGGVR